MAGPEQDISTAMPGAAGVVEQLSRFEGPPEEFLARLLAAQCRLASAQGGVILRPGQNSRAEVLAVFPPPAKGTTPPVWLAQAAESAPEVFGARGTKIKPLHGPHDMYGQPAGQHLVMIPLGAGQGVQGAAAYLVQTRDQKALSGSQERLELTISLLSLYQMRLMLGQRQASLQRLREGMETLSAVNGQKRFAGSAMAFCNEIAARWQCDRVGLGFLKGRYVHLRAMSHTEKFSRKMKLVQDVESAMEECLDQDVEVFYPSEAEASFVNRAAGDLSKRHGPTSVLSLPLRSEGEVVAVLTVERPWDQPFGTDEIESLRLLCELCTARLVNLHEHDRWFGAKAAAGVSKGMGLLVGPKHTWAKLIAILVLAAVIFLVFVKGKYKAEASFVLEATERRVVPVAFDGFIKSVEVEPGDAVKAGETVLATLRTNELRLELINARAQREGYSKEADAASREGEIARAQMAQARADQAQTQIDLLEYRISQARIVSPIDGIVVSGDLKRQIGAPVQTGQVLFEVASLESLRAELAVPEDQILEVKEGFEGELAVVGEPGQRVKFVVERINPIAELVKQRNVVKVQVRLGRRHDWMKPGMEGVAKITINEDHSYGWVWTRRLVNWLRMKLWL